MNPKQDWIEKAKRSAALEAVKHVEDGFIVGLGSGSTAIYAIQEMGKKIRKDKLSILGIPTSYQAQTLAVKNGIHLTTLEAHPRIDLTIDGADQIDNELNLIKGMGGALAREKIVASSSKKLIIITDETKKVQYLGEKNHPVPIEVLPFALPLVTQIIEKMRGKSITRETHGKVGPVITDNGNMIIDAYFGRIQNPVQLEGKLKAVTGVVETGLFLGMARLAYVGKSAGVDRLAVKGASRNMG